MKLSDSYLCPDCNEVFEPDRTVMIHVKNPVCPGCGNMFNMSIGRVLNRKPESVTSAKMSLDTTICRPISTAQTLYLAPSLEELMARRVVNPGEEGRRHD